MPHAAQHHPSPSALARSRRSGPPVPPPDPRERSRRGAWRKAAAGIAAVALAAPFAGAVAPAVAQAQSIVNYYESLPPPSPITAETRASRQFELYGDTMAPGYLDEAPRDGVDDRRGDRLMQIAERFSPILRRNTFQVPMEFEDFLDDRVRMQVDAWRDHRRVDSAAVDLGPPLSASVGAYRGAELVAPDDSLLLALMLERGPRRLRAPITQPGGPPDTILYIDVPGGDEVTWRQHHRDRVGRSRIYAHPFIHEVEDQAGRFEFLIQYWFFFAFNDGGNNHEGDWEHITVSITTFDRARAGVDSSGERGLLSEAEIRSLLDYDLPTPLDSLRIRNVAYYFHNNVMILDYLGIEAGETMWRRAEGNDGSIHIWEDTRYMDNAVRARVGLAGGRLATHPLGYIGGNNKGTDELLHLWPRFQGSYNRDSHGTYPFPGIWRQVGPADATEKIYGEIEPQVRLDAAGNPDRSREWYELLVDDRYLVYRAEDIVLLPDWERLEHLALTDPVIRRRWAWFILPVHMGYPTTPSPGAGTLKRVDLGNVAPMSPAYNNAWNRPGVTATYPHYQATVLRVALAPVSPLASLQSGWGLLNIPIVIWGMLPGGNVATTQLLPWITGAMHVMGSPPAKTFFTGELPERFTSLSGGGYRQIGGHDFARLLPEPTHPAVQAELTGSASEDARIADPRQVSHWGSRAWFNVYFGPRVSIENTLGYGLSSVSYTVEGAQGQPLGQISGTLDMREVTGGINYRLTPPQRKYLRLYARTGYAWTSYRLTQVTVGDQPPDAELGLRGGRLPTIYPSATWWPNTTYAGLGLEVFTPPRHWLFNRLGVGARVEAGGSLHRLPLGGTCNCRVTAERGDVAFMLLFGW